METVFIYGLFDAREGEHRIHYVGKTKDLDKRLYNHANRSHSKRVRKWVESISPANLRLVILQECGPEDWEEAERELVSFWREFNAELLNVAPGGSYPDGLTGRMPKPWCVRHKIHKRFRPTAHRLYYCPKCATTATRKWKASPAGAEERARRGSRPSARAARVRYKSRQDRRLNPQRF